MSEAKKTYMDQLEAIRQRDIHEFCTEGGDQWSNLAATWDVIEEQAKENGYCVFHVEPTMLDALRLDLLVIEAEHRRVMAGDHHTINGVPISACVEHLGNEDVKVLRAKDAEYGGSWLQRGGVGAFMMLARKWDRIVNQVKKYSWHLPDALRADGRQEGILDDIGDLRRYLMLVSAEMSVHKSA